MSVVTSASATTRYYGLPIFEADDKPSYLTDWNGTMTEIDSLLKAQHDDIEANKGDILGLLTRQSRLENALNSLDVIAQTLSNHLSLAESDIQTIKNTLIQIDTEVKNTSSRVTALTTRVENLESRANGFDTSLTELDRSVDQRVDELTNNVNAQIGQQNQKIDTTTGDLTTQTSQIAGNGINLYKADATSRMTCNMNSVNLANIFAKMGKCPSSNVEVKRDFVRSNTPSTDHTATIYVGEPVAGSYSCHATLIDVAGGFQQIQRGNILMGVRPSTIGNSESGGILPVTEEVSADLFIPRGFQINYNNGNFETRGQEFVDVKFYLSTRVDLGQHDDNKILIGTRKCKVNATTSYIGCVIVDDDLRGFMNGRFVSTKQGLIDYHNAVLSVEISFPVELTSGTTPNTVTLESMQFDADYTTSIPYAIAQGV